MEIKININVCRVCLKPPVEPVSLFCDQDATVAQAAGNGGGAGGANMGALARQFTAVTQLEVSTGKEEGEKKYRSRRRRRI